jgi:hypothetical protein
MNLEKIVTISGKPGLYKVLSTTKTGMIVESFADNRRFTAFSYERISSLKEISVFTTHEDKPLEEVFKLIFDKQKGGTAISPKSDPRELIAFFAEAVPDYNTEKVYVSDMRKILSWYNIMVEKNMLDFSAKEEEKEEEKDANEKPSEHFKAKPADAAAAASKSAKTKADLPKMKKTTRQKTG